MNRYRSLREELQISREYRLQGRRREAIFWHRHGQIGRHLEMRWMGMNPETATAYELPSYRHPRPAVYGRLP